LADLVTHATAAVALEMGPTFMAELKKSLVEKFLPDLAPDKQTEIEDDIDQVTEQVEQENRDMKKGEIKSFDKGAAA
jgi:hypothetical protein